MGLPIDGSFLTVEAGPPGLPVVAMTDDGLSVLRMKPGSIDAGPELSWETVLTERSVLAGTGTFLSNLGLVRDVDGDGRADILFPTPDGVSVYLSGSDGLRSTPASRVRFPLDDLQKPGGDPLVRRYPLPELRDVDGDHLPDLVLLHPTGGVRGFRVLRNLGGGRFGEPLAPFGDFLEESDRRDSGGSGGTGGSGGSEKKPEPAWFGDLDGDGRAEYVTQEEKEVSDDDAGMREEMRAAKRPQVTYRLHRSRADLTTISSKTGLRIFAGTKDPRRDLLNRRPRQTIDLAGAEETVTISVGVGNEGATTESSRPDFLGGPQVMDLDGDGRPEFLLSSPNAGGRGRVMVVRLGG